MSATREDWQSLAERSLGGSLETLARRGIDALANPALSVRRYRDAPRLSSRSGAWHVAQRVDHPDPEAANRQALADLEGGADALSMVTRGSPFTRGFGLQPTDLAAALEGVELDLVPARLDAGSDVLAAAEEIRMLVKRRRWTSAGLDLDLAYDPIGLAARLGRPLDPSWLARLLETHEDAGLHGHPLLADGRPFHEAGATPAQELAALVAAGIAYLRRLEREGLDLETARTRIAFLTVVEGDVAVSLAKIRAARRLWARVEAASGLEPMPIKLHVETSWRQMSRFDPWVNMMRITAGIAAAGLGGADVVTALPFTAAGGLPDQWARRLARNAQRMLIDEAHLDAVEDPANGAGSFEDLTDALCDDAWKGIQDIEREDGLEASLAAGHVRLRLSQAASARAASFARQTATLVGTSRFPNLDRVRFGLLDVPPHQVSEPHPDALPSLRDALPFERLRNRVDALPAQPRVHLVALGTPAAFGPRAVFAANTFAVAGLSVAVPTQAGDPAAFDRELKTQCTTVACLVGPDDAYASKGLDIVAALRAAGATFVIVAGAEDSALDLGADLAVNATCDLLFLLDATLAALGVR